MNNWRGHTQRGRTRRKEKGEHKERERGEIVQEKIDRKVDRSLKRQRLSEQQSKGKCNGGTSHQINQPVPWSCHKDRYCLLESCAHQSPGLQEDKMQIMKSERYSPMINLRLSERKRLPFQGHTNRQIIVCLSDKLQNQARVLHCFHGTKRKVAVIFYSNFYS